MGKRTCSVEGCGRVTTARGWCHRHYQNFLRIGEPIAGKPRDTPEIFWSNVRVGEPKECWPWLAGRATYGYGSKLWGGKVRGAHRISYFPETGAWPEEVLHLCDNPPCVNPAHLTGGSHAENMADMSKKGRGARGVVHPNSKLTEEMVIEIRRRHHAGESTLSIAKDFPVNVTTARRVIIRKMWKHVE